MKKVKTISNPNVAEIKEMILQLPQKQILALISEIEEEIDWMAITQLAEMGFKEWNDPEENIYDKYQ
ncbi:MAG: hypothetical protein KME64_16585 [Scytonematopsis contorta HA4267-MV1]|jgi:hypothetical protein|nr:hypothetical protein [Scytonematopsis contorta HA4267-MV1]